MGNNDFNHLPLGVSQKIYILAKLSVGIFLCVRSCFATLRVFEPVGTLYWSPTSKCLTFVWTNVLSTVPQTPGSVENVLNCVECRVRFYNTMWHSEASGKQKHPQGAAGVKMSRVSVSVERWERGHDENTVSAWGNQTKGFLHFSPFFLPFSSSLVSFLPSFSSLPYLCFLSSFLLYLLCLLPFFLPLSNYSDSLISFSSFSELSSKLLKAIFPSFFLTFLLSHGISCQF